MSGTPTTEAGLFGQGGMVYATFGGGAAFTTGNANSALGQQGGYPNDSNAYNYLRNKVLPYNQRANSEAYAQAYVAVTLAGANNLTVLNVNGVPQITGVVAMTAGDIPASVASIVTAVNSFNAALPNNYRAVASGNGFWLIQTTAGATFNNQVVTVTFSSSASTATSTPVGGGTSLGGYHWRVWIDTSLSADANTISGVEITDQVSFQGLQTPPVITDVSVAVGHSISFARIVQGQQVRVDGVSSAGSPAFNRIDSIVAEGIKVGDIVCFTGKDGAVPAIFVQSADLVLGTSIVTLSSDSDTLWLRFQGPLKYAQVVPSNPSVEYLRDEGQPLPVQPGVHVLNPPAGGTHTIHPGVTGTSDATNTYEPDISLEAGAVIVLASTLDFQVDAVPALKGESGVVAGEGRSIDINGNTVVFSDPSGVQATLTEQLALSGLWRAEWFVIDNGGAASVSWSVTPVFDNSAAGFINTLMIADANVTNAKLATGIDGAKVSAGTLPEASLTTALQAKVNAVSDIGTAVATNFNVVNGTTYDVDATLGNLIGTLPAIAAATYQRCRFVKTDTSTNTVTIQGDATIAGGLTFVLQRQYESVTLVGNGTNWSVVASEPQTALEATIVISGLTTIDMTAANTRCTTFIISSINATEAVTTITNAPKNVDFELRPENGLALTLTGTASGGAVNTIVLQAASLVLDGTLDEYARFRWSATRTQWIYQDSNQGIV